MKVSIEKLVYGGDGLARLPEDEQGRRKAVFVPFVIDGEEAEVEIAEDKPAFARAKLKQVTLMSSHRVEPGCPYFFRCGGCQYQHMTYEHQLRAKEQILRETVARFAKVELPNVRVHSSGPWQYRNRTRMHVRTLPDFAIGYYEFGSRKLLPVESCPISSPLINRAVGALWEEGHAQHVPAGIQEIQFFVNHDDSAILLEFYIDRNADPESIEPLWERLHGSVPELQGAVVFPSVLKNEDDEQRAPLIMNVTGPEAGFFGESSITYRAAGRDYRVSGGSFFQTNKFLLDELVSIVINEQRGDTALDLYAGAGLFTKPLTESFRQVIAVEASPYSHADLKVNAPKARAIRAKTEQYLEGAGAKLRPDLVVVDPPRSGLGERVAKAIARIKVPQVTYVSCDPATLSRDLRPLLQSGFRIEQAHLVDLFPQTYHLESVIHLAR